MGSPLQRLIAAEMQHRWSTIDCTEELSSVLLIHLPGSMHVPLSYRNREVSLTFRINEFPPLYLCSSISIPILSSLSSRLVYNTKRRVYAGTNPARIRRAPLLAGPGRY